MSDTCARDDDRQCGNDFISNLFGSCRIVCAPMVLGSELAFRMLVRQHGVHLCYTPMLRSDKLASGDAEEVRLLETTEGDRPLVVQICGRDPDILAEAVRHIFHVVRPDAVDLNLGCPQDCAKEGGFGAFLQEEPERVAACVRAMRDAAAPSPIFCKARILESVEKTVAFARLLEEAGCSALALHCRHRVVKHDGAANFEHLTAVIANLSIPVVANGGISSMEEAKALMASTGAAAVMSATALLQNPRAFSSANPADAVKLALEYLDSVQSYPPPSSLYVRKHLRWIFRSELEPAYHQTMNCGCGLELPADYATICHTYFREGRCLRENCKFRHVQNFTRPTRDQNGNLSLEDSEWNWRARAWTFLVRPYLESLWQFREVVRLIAYHLGQQVPLLMGHANDVSTFGDIRAGKSASGQGNVADVGDEEGVFSLDELFDM